MELATERDGQVRLGRAWRGISRLACAGDGPSMFLLLREQPRPVAGGVLAGEVPDLEVPACGSLIHTAIALGSYGLSFSATSTARISSSTYFSGGGYPVRCRRLSWRKDSPTTCRSSSPARRAGWISSCVRTALSLRELSPPEPAGWTTFRELSPPGRRDGQLLVVFGEIASCRASRCHSPSGASCMGAAAGYYHQELLPPPRRARRGCAGVKPGWSVVGSQPIASSGLR